jgi:hypothetical protein
MNQGWICEMEIGRTRDCNRGALESGYDDVTHLAGCEGGSGIATVTTDSVEVHLGKNGTGSGRAWVLICLKPIYNF